MNDYSNKELVVRKTTSAFVEKLFVYSGYDLPHDIYKDIMYNNKKCMSNTEDKIKRYYDGYMLGWKELLKIIIEWLS